MSFSLVNIYSFYIRLYNVEVLTVQQGTLSSAPMESILLSRSIEESGTSNRPWSLQVKQLQGPSSV